MHSIGTLFIEVLFMCMHYSHGTVHKLFTPLFMYRFTVHIVHISVHHICEQCIQYNCKLECKNNNVVFLMLDTVAKNVNCRSLWKARDAIVIAA